MEIQQTRASNWAKVNICGKVPQVEFQLVVPRKIQSIVTYGVDVPKINIDMSVLKENKYEITNLQVMGAPVSTVFLTKLSLPKIIRKIAEKAIPNSGYWARLQDTAPTDEYLVQLYWFEHLTWGKPREAIMKATGWSRPNANYHLRRLSKKYLLPGPHYSKYESQQ